MRVTRWQVAGHVVLAEVIGIGGLGIQDHQLVHDNLRPAENDRNTLGSRPSPGGTNVNPPPLEVRVEEVGLHNWQVDRDSAIQLQHGHLALLAPDRPKTALPVLHVSCRRTGPTIQP